MNRIRLAYEICKTQGIRWVGYRLRNSLSHRLGLIERKLPIREWGSIEVGLESLQDWQQQCGKFLFNHQNRIRDASTFHGFDEKGVDWDRCIEQIASGEISYFSNTPIKVGFPPQWNNNLLQGLSGPAKIHFSRINEFGSGDVKCIWEPNRFGFAYNLIRAYWRTGSDRAAEVFWLAAED